MPGSVSVVFAGEAAGAGSKWRSRTVPAGRCHLRVGKTVPFLSDLLLPGSVNQSE